MRCCRRPRSVLGVLILCFGASVSPAPGQAALEVSGALASRYIARGIDAFSGNAAFQPSITYSLGSVSLGVWASLAAVGRAERPGGATQSVGALDEVDVTLSWSRPVGAVEVSAGVIHYNWFRGKAWPDAVTTTYETFLGAALPSLPLSPELVAYYDPNPEGGDGLYLGAAAAHSFAENGALPLTLSLSAGYMDQSWIPEAGISDVNAGVATSFTAGSLVLSPSLTYTLAPPRDPGAGRHTVWGSIQASWTR